MHTAGYGSGGAGQAQSRIPLRRSGDRRNCAAFDRWGSGLASGQSCVCMSRFDTSCLNSSYSHYRRRTELHGHGPVPATHQALPSAGLSVDTLYVVEINVVFGMVSPTSGCYAVPGRCQLGRVMQLADDGEFSLPFEYQVNAVRGDVLDMAMEGLDMKTPQPRRSKSSDVMIGQPCTLGYPIVRTGSGDRSNSCESSLSAGTKRL